MRQYTINDLRRALERAGVASGDMVLVHSSLFPLGRLHGVDRRLVPLRLVQTMLDAIGPKGTLVVPTFCWGFCRGERFDRRTTPSQGMGLFAEVVRGLPSARRSRHPMQSVSVVGPAADWLTSGDPGSAFSPGGAFRKLVDADAKLVLLGAPLQSVSLVHLAEEEQRVPYRYFKSFEGPYCDDEGERWCSYEMYVRDLELDPRLDLSRLESPLKACGAMQSAIVGSGHITVVPARVFHDTVSSWLQADPWALVRQPSCCGGSLRAA